MGNQIAEQAAAELLTRFESKECENVEDTAFGAEMGLDAEDCRGIDEMVASSVPAGAPSDGVVLSWEATPARRQPEWLSNRRTFSASSSSKLLFCSRQGLKVRGSAGDGDSPESS